MKKVFKKWTNFKLSAALILTFCGAAMFAQAQCSLNNLSYTLNNKNADEVSICYQFTATQKASNRYDVLLNNFKIKTTAYATLLLNAKHPVPNSNFNATCFTLGKNSLKPNNVLKVQDQANKQCSVKLEFDTPDFNKDKVAIQQPSHQYNFINSHQNGIPMSLQLPQKNMLANGSTELPITLGSKDVPVNGLHGIRFNLQLAGKIKAIQAVEVDFLNSWLSNDGDPLKTHTEFNPKTGQLHIGLTKTNGQSISGYGNIATLRIIILIEIEPEKKAAHFFNAKINDIQISTKSKGFELISNMGINLQYTKAQKTFENNPPNHFSSDVRLYPTMVNHQFTIQKNDLINMECVIFDLIGNVVHQSNFNNKITTIKTNHWRSGLYCVNLIKNSQTLSKRILVRH